MDSPCVRCQTPWGQCIEPCKDLWDYKQANAPTPIHPDSEEHLSWILSQPYCSTFVAMNGRSFTIIKVVHGSAFILHEGTIGD